MNLRALDVIAPYCDIEERLRAVPPAARIRGLAFRAFASVLRRAGKISAYDEMFGADPYNSMALYPLGDYLVRLAYAGSLMRSPGELLQGMYDISLENAREYSSSMLGRMLVRLLARDPVKLSEQGLAMRRQTYIYGHWELRKHGPRDIEMMYFDEYIWIEHSMAAAALGTFETCGIRPQLQTTLRDRWNGSTRIQW